jgi:hypothetical protein
MGYKPDPVDTSGVVLPNGVEHLTEVLARNTHEVWAARKMAEGWKFGRTADAHLKTHPCLVPYDHLPDAMREYDRATATGALKLVVKLGFNIVKRKEKVRT